MNKASSSTPFGAWPSSIDAQMLVAQSVRLAGVALDGQQAFWLEGRAEDGGRNVLVCAASPDSIADLTVAPWNVRSRVHEYGGGAFTVQQGIVWFVHDGDQRLYRLEPNMPPVAVTPEGPYRYADPVIVGGGEGVVCVREEHHDDREPSNALVWVSEQGVEVVADGHDFFAYPRISPDGQLLAYIAWDHPNMPWDGTTLYVAPIVAQDGTAGRVGAPERIAGGEEESIFQPQWAPDGTLWYVSDSSGFWNLYRVEGGAGQRVIAEQADYGMPLWQFAMSTYGFADAHTLLAASCVQGLWRVQAVDLRDMSCRTLPIPVSAVSGLVAGDGQALILGASATLPSCVMRWDLVDDSVQILRRSSDIQFAQDAVSQPETIEFPSTDGVTSHGFFYPPTNPSCRAADGELPPLIVIGHGGPTGATTPAFDLGVQFWTSRGFAVFDVNYRGSTGYGRAYRSLLDGQWGVADVEDCVNGARYLAQAGLVDAQRMAIRGRSAGGYTVLAALAFHDVFAAGASYYGIGELEALARDTHKFESRYMDRLVGPYPQCAELYRQRSPINHVNQLSCPVIFFQGLEDRVVPPNQAQMMRDALDAKGIAVACMMFEGEQHGFRRAETIIRTLESELVFYGKVFDFQPAGNLPDVAIENL